MGTRIPNKPLRAICNCMVSLTFYGGVGEIGGNKILLEDGRVRI